MFYKFFENVYTILKWELCKKYFFKLIIAFVSLGNTKLTYMKNLTLKAIASILFMALSTLACKGKSDDANPPADDGAAKSEVTETGQHIGSDTDSTTVISD